MPSENYTVRSNPESTRRPRLMQSISSIGTSFRKLSTHLHFKGNKLQKSNSTPAINLVAVPDSKPGSESVRIENKSPTSCSCHTQGMVDSPENPAVSSTRVNPTSFPKQIHSPKNQQPINVTGPVPQQVPQSTFVQPADRRNSMMWVDFLTTPGLKINGNHHDETTTSSIETFNDELTRINTSDDLDKELVSPSPVSRGIWFQSATEEQDLFDDFEEEDCTGKSKAFSKRLTGGFDCPRNNFYRKTRKDSIPSSTRSRASPTPDGAGNNHRNVDDLIFDMFQEKDEEVAIVGTFLAALAKTGLRKDDPRLAELFDNLRRVHKDQETNFPGRIGSIETLRLDRETFKMIITDNIVLISKAFRQQFVIPEFKTFCGHLEEMYWRCRDVKGGKVAGYIPQLARVDPTLWGVSICTTDGQRYSIGDTNIPFTIQSCSKPLTYAVALNELGEDTVHQYVGQEPSGRMFNELVLDHNKKPHNPMVNAGAIIICSLLKSMVRPEMSLAEKFDYTHNYFRKLCGGEYVGFNNAVFLSEREAADRNFALGFYMRENKCFPEGTNLQECMDYYFQICSMECNCEAMSVMAATLANGGICPVSGEKVLKSESVRDVLSLMHSCGMYDYSGQFAFKVGLPAKSGVSGAIMLVVPNVFGMAVWSPPLDVLGNSLRGVALCQEIVSVFNFHKYDNLRHASDKLDPRRHRYETKGLNIVNLLFSAASGDVTSMRRHHLSGMDMNASDYDGRTALHLAAAEGHLECVEYLVRHGHVAPTPFDRWGHLPLDDAVRFEHEDVAQFLMKWTADNPD